MKKLTGLFLICFILSFQLQAQSKNQTQNVFRGEFSLFKKWRGSLPIPHWGGERVFFDTTTFQCKKFYMLGRGGYTHHLETKPVSDQNCRPYFIAQALKNALGSCQPSKVSSRVFGEAGSEIRLTRNCLCIEESYARGKSLVDGSNGTISGVTNYNECLPHFPTAEKYIVKQIIDFQEWTDPKNVYLGESKSEWVTGLNDGEESSYNNDSYDHQE